MKNILITGATGFLGSEVVKSIPSDSRIFLLSRSKPKQENVIWLRGDITRSNLGLTEVPIRIDACLHLAALVELSEKQNKEIFLTNFLGTENVLQFCLRNDIQNFIFVSTSYTQGRNSYEKSKFFAELLVAEYSERYELRTTIIKPSIIIGSPQNPGTDQTLNKVALTILKVHSQAEGIRKRVQETMALPPLELGFRVRGDPESTLNLVPVDVVAENIIGVWRKQSVYSGKQSVFYITNPNPPLLKDVAAEVSEALNINVRVMKDFRPSPPEKILEKLLSPFLPYLEGEPIFPTVLDASFQLPQGYIGDTVKAFIRRG